MNASTEPPAAAETNNTPRQQRCSQGHRHGGRGHGFRRFLIITGVAALGFAAGHASADHPHGWGLGKACHHGVMASPEKRAAFAHKMLEKRLDSVKATAEQKQKAGAILTAALTSANDPMPKMQAHHEQLLTLLAAPSLNQTAIEAWRVEGVQQMQKNSQLMLNTIVKIAEVLTPEQRKQLATQAKDHKGGPGFGPGLF